MKPWPAPSQTPTKSRGYTVCANDLRHVQTTILSPKGSETAALRLLVLDRGTITSYNTGQNYPYGEHDGVRQAAQWRSNDASRHIDLNSSDCETRWMPDPTQTNGHTGTFTFVGISREFVRDEICCHRTYTMRINDIILERNERHRMNTITRNSLMSFGSRRNREQKKPSWFGRASRVRERG